MNGNYQGRRYRFRLERMDAYRVARELMGLVHLVTARWPRGNADLKDQATRAVDSAFLNLGEGLCQPLGSGLKTRHYAISLASTGEVVTAVDAAAVRRLSSMADIERVMDLAGRLGALLGGLLRTARRNRTRR